MSALNKTRSMRLPSFAAQRVLGLAHSRSAGTLAATSTSGEGTPVVQTPQKVLPEQKRYASLGRGSSSRRRTSNPCEHDINTTYIILIFLQVSSVPRSPGGDASVNTSSLAAAHSRSVSFGLLALSPVREQTPLLPLAGPTLSASPSSGPYDVAALESSIAALQVAIPESTIGHDLSTALGPSLSSASSLHSLASLLSAPSLQLDAAPEASCTPRKSRLPSSLVPRADERPESPIAHARRCARRSSMFMQRSSEQYTFCARVPKGLSTEMVTVYVKRGCRLAVIADAWHLEHDGTPTGCGLSVVVSSRFPQRITNGRLGSPLGTSISVLCMSYWTRVGI